MRAIKVLGRLKGYSIVIIEHSLDVIKTADYIGELAPEDSDGGSRIVASGSLDEVVKESYTGKYLKKM